MTHKLGIGTVNLQVNVPAEERLALGRAAFNAGAKSVGDYLRKLVLKGAEAENPELAAHLREVRRAYYGATCLIVFVLGLLCGSVNEARRVRTARRVEEIREEVA